MKDYVDRDTVIFNVRMAMNTDGEIMNAIYNTPAANVVPAEHGSWYRIGNTGLATCQCGYFTDRYSVYNFCPNCGARMDGDAE